MQVLEKILQEIEDFKKQKFSSIHPMSVDKIGVWCCDKIAEIIRSHMGDDGWIPVTWNETTEEDGIDMVRYPVCLDCPMPEPYKPKKGGAEDV